jgi:hypothetical protein
MRANARLFWLLAGFFILLAVIYTVWSFLFDSQDLATTASITGSGIDWVGTVALTLAGIASALIAFYVGRTHAAQGGELPEDRVDANIDDGDAEQGFFSPWSWWPITMAGSLGLVFLGMAVGFWLVLIALPLLAIAVTGWVYEYYRGYFAH